MPLPPETIKTCRLLLRPYRFEDVDDIIAYAAKEEWSRYMPIPYPYERKDAEEWIAKQTIRDRDIHAAWAIEFAGKVIGGVDLIFTPASRAGFLGYSLAPEVWNQGIMTEAVGAVIDHAFEADSGLNRIWAWADSRNTASLRVMEKLGMSREGCLREHNMIRGEFVDAVYCAILRAEWQGRR